MNIKVQLEDGTNAPFKTEIINDTITVTITQNERDELNLFPTWEELESFSGCYVGSDCSIYKANGFAATRAGNKNVFTTSNLAEAVIATAKVSQTYKRYRELLGEVDNLPVVISYGLTKLAFRNGSDWDKFYMVNKEDLELIFNVSSIVQL